MSLKIKRKIGNFEYTKISMQEFENRIILDISEITPHGVDKKFIKAEETTRGKIIEKCNDSIVCVYIQKRRYSENRYITFNILTHHEYQTDDEACGDLLEDHKDMIVSSNKNTLIVIKKNGKLQFYHCSNNGIELADDETKQGDSQTDELLGKI